MTFISDPNAFITAHVGASYIKPHILSRAGWGYYNELDRLDATCVFGLCDNKAMETAHLQEAPSGYYKPSPTLRYLFGALAGVFVLLLLLSSARIIPLVILGIIGYAYLLQQTGKAKWPIKRLWTAFWLVLLFVRVDISFINLPGPPRVVPYVIGHPGRETMERARRGEVVLNGCTATLLEPLWVVVW